MQKKTLFLGIILLVSSFGAFAGETGPASCAGLLNSYYINGILGNANSTEYGYAYPIFIKVNSVNGNSISGQFQLRNSSAVPSVPFSGTCTEQNGVISNIIIKGENTDFTVQFNPFINYANGSLISLNVTGYVTDNAGGKMTIQSGDSSHITIAYPSV